MLQSICCLFSRSCDERSERSTSTRRNELPSAKVDLGQSEAGLEKTGKEQMGRMEGDEAQIIGFRETLSLPAPHRLVGFGARRSLRNTTSWVLPTVWPSSAVSLRLFCAQSLLCVRQ